MASQSNNHLTATVAYNGIHVIDLTTSHPVSSYTVGPQTHFTCPSVSRVESHPSGSQTRNTYAVIEEAPDMPSEQEGRTIWVWSDPLERGAVEAALGQKQAFQVPDRIAALLAPEELEHAIILLSPTGSLTITHSQSFSQLSKRDPKIADGGYTLLRPYYFSTSECSFDSRKDAGSPAITLVSISEKTSAGGTELLISITSISQSGTLMDDSGREATADISGACIAMALNAAGHLTVLTSGLELLSFMLKAAPDNKLELISSSNTLKLNSTRLYVDSKSPVKATTQSTVSCLSLGDSRILLAGLSEKDRQIHMLIWDLNYNALLASRSQPIPPSVCRDGVSNIMVDLSSAGPSQAILVLSTPSNYKYLKGSSSDLSRESVILNIPYVVPSRSSLSSVVGKGDAARDWLAPSATSDVPKELAGAIVNPNEATVIKRMNQILSRNHDEEGFRKADEVVMDYLQDLFDRDKRTKLSSLVSHEFVSAILRILLPPPPSPTGNLLKTPPTVTKLISQGAISQIQLLNEGGVVGILRQRNDWVAIGTCLKHIPDISEDILVQLLHDVVAAHLSTTVDTSDGMDVDRPAQPRAVSIPPLSSFLESTMAYPTSSQALRIALRKHLKVEHATAILQVLDTKMDSICESDPLEPVDSSFERILLMVQAIMDSFLILFLQHSPSHFVLQSLFDKLTSASDLVEQLQTLLTPLAQFSKAEEEAKSKKPASAPLDKDQWMTRRNQRRGAAELNIGDYQVEDLVF